VTLVLPPSLFGNYAANHSAEISLQKFSEIILEKSFFNESSSASILQLSPLSNPPHQSLRFEHENFTPFGGDINRISHNGGFGGNGSRAQVDIGEDRGLRNQRKAAGYAGRVGDGWIVAAPSGGWRKNEGHGTQN